MLACVSELETFSGLLQPIAQMVRDREFQGDREGERKMTLGIWVALVSHDFVAVCVDFPQRFSVFSCVYH